MTGRERGVSMAGKRKKIGRKVNGLLLAMVSLSIFLTGGISIYSLYTMKKISVDSSRMLGQTAADDAEQALEEMAEEKLRDVAVEKAAYIEEKFRAVEAYVLGIAELAGQIYDHPERYPDRMVDLPVPDSKSLAVQLLWSKRLSVSTPEEQAALPKTVEAGDAANTEFSGGEEEESGGKSSRTKGEETDLERNKSTEGTPEQGFGEWERMLGVLTCASEGEKGELRKLGNIQNLLEQYNSHNDMVSSTYLATESGWMIQADYISFSKYEEEPETAEDGKTLLPMLYEADEREWYVLAKEEPAGQVIYTDVIKDVHRGEDCIVCASPVYHNGKIVAVAGVGSYLETVNNAVLDTIIGQEGYAFLVNRKGQVMVSGKRQGETAACAEQNLDLRQSANQELAEAAKRMVAGHSGYLQLTVDGQEVCMAYAPLSRLGWSFVTVIGVAEVIAPARQSQDTILSLTDYAAQEEATNCREELYGEQRLMAAAKSSGGCPPKELLNRIWRDVDSFQKDAEQFDDITMMAVAYHGKGFAEKAGRPVVKSIREFSVFVEDVLAEKGVSLKTILKIQMAVDELLSNICYYSGAGEMTLAVRVEESEEVVEGSTDKGAEELTYKSGDCSGSRRVTLIIEDDGIPYNPLERPDPDVEELLEKRTQGGLGIYLVKKRMDQMEYEYKDDMNRLTLRKWDV